MPFSALAFPSWALSGPGSDAPLSDTRFGPVEFTRDLRAAECIISDGDYYAAISRLERVIPCALGSDTALDFQYSFGCVCSNSGL